MRSGVVTQFRHQLWQVKILKALRLQVQSTRDHQAVVETYLERVKLRRVWRALVRYRHQRYIETPPFHGGFLKCSEILLRTSFGQVMDTVWEEFPNQKLQYNMSSGHEHQLLNYLGLS